MDVKDSYGFEGTVEQAILHEINSAPGYYDGELEAMRQKLKAMSEMVARFMASKISDAEGLNSIVGYARYWDDK